MLGNIMKPSKAREVCLSSEYGCIGHAEYEGLEGIAKAQQV